MFICSDLLVSWLRFRRAEAVVDRGLVPQLARYHDAPLPVQLGGQRHAIFPIQHSVCVAAQRLNMWSD